MGSSNEKIKVSVIDQKQMKRDFNKLIENDHFSCNYYESYQKFLENQSLKELSYIIIRQQEEEKNKSNDQKEAQDKIKESSVVAKTFQNMQDLNNQFNNNKNSRKPRLRQQLISYIRKYSLEKIMIYLFVRNALNFKISEYEEPYITLIADKIETIMSRILQRPRGAQPLSFKFRRMIKDLYRRTVVAILTSKTDKNVEKQWKKKLNKITYSISQFDEEKFKSSLMSNYYNYIVVNNSETLSVIQDMKKKHKFQSLLIYHGDINKYGMEESNNFQVQEKVEEVKRSIWMHSQKIDQICTAIKDCTDIFAQENNLPAQNIIIYTKLKYGKDNNDYFVKQLKKKMLQKQKVTQQKISLIKFTVISEQKQIIIQCKKVSFSFMITFDLSIDDIEVLKSCLRREQFDKRVYMYNADEQQSVIDTNKNNINNSEVIKPYLQKRAQVVADKAKFLIKFEIGPLEEITTYKATEQQLAYLSCEMGLITTNIESQDDFKQSYMSVNRLKIINGFFLVIKVQEYFSQYIKLVEKEMKKDPQSYLKKVKIIIHDNQQAIKRKWEDIKKEIKGDRVIFVHYKQSKISQFLDMLFTSRINLTIFKKKTLPNFYKAYQILEQCKFHPLKLTGSIVSKNELLKQVFGDQNFKLSTQYQLSFLKLANTNKNLEETLLLMHEQFLVKYGRMWSTGYKIVSDRLKKDQKRESDLKKDQKIVSEHSNKDQKGMCINNLKQDIKTCLYKCKSYELLQVSQQQFQYFYLKRLQQCYTYIDLQIAVIYMFSLPHGLSSVVQMIFSDTLSTCMAPKTFAGYIVTLLSCFCSFEDEVMNKQRFVIYIDETNTDHFSSIIGGLKIGDVLFNSSFIMCGKDNKNENVNNHCLFLQFQDIPMLSQTHVKNYLKIERFSFYKQSTEYLIAPYTQFTVKNLFVSAMGKKHITLSATSDSKKGFVSKVFDANNIKQQSLFQSIEFQVQSLNGTFNQREKDKIMKTDSLYKKAEMISLYQEKYELIKSIKQGLQYNKFLKDARAKKYISALSHIKIKEQHQKTTTQIQATYFKKMLSVQKAMLYYHLCEYDKSLEQLDKVTQYLQEQEGQGAEWGIRKIQRYRQNIQDLKIKRQKYLNRFQKKKNWRIQAEVTQSDKQNKIGVKMSAKTMNWSVGYNCCLEEFYIKLEKEKSQKLVHYSIKPPFGELAIVFPADSAYQKITDRPEQNRNCNHLTVASLSDQKVNPKQTAKRDSKKKDTVLTPIRDIKTDPSKQDKDLQSQIGKNNKPLKKSPVEAEDNSQVQPLSKHKANSVPEQLETKQKDKKERQLDVPTFQKVIKQDSGRLFDFSNKSHISQKEFDQQVRDSEMRMGVSKTMNWQVFFFDGKFILVQKGKHYKAILPILRH